VIVSYHMSEWRTFRAELRAPRSDLAVLLTTFLLTVLIDLTVAVQAGMVLAAFLFMRRMAEVTDVRAWSPDDDGDEELRDVNSIAGREIPPGVEVYEVNGPFFFGAATKFRDTIATVSNQP